MGVTTGMGVARGPWPHLKFGGRGQRILWPHLNFGKILAKIYLALEKCALFSGIFYKNNV